MSAANLPALLQRFFTERLQSQLGASPYTVASYRDTFRLLLVFASARLKRAPSQLRVEDLSAALIGAFLHHLEHERACTPKTRNLRLTAVRSFFRFVAYAEPACSLQCQQVLAIPSKRHERPTVEFLTEEETAALVVAPDPITWIGRRDRTLLQVAAQTGLRSAEIRNLRCCDVHLGVGAHVRCFGKGRKTRCTPLRRDVATALDAWLLARGGGRTIPSSRAHVAASSAQTLCRHSSPGTSPRRARSALRSGGDRSRHTRFGTRPPCIFCGAVSI